MLPTHNARAWLLIAALGPACVYESCSTELQTVDPAPTAPPPAPQPAGRAPAPAALAPAPAPEPALSDPSPLTEPGAPLTPELAFQGWALSVLRAQLPPRGEHPESVILRWGGQPTSRPDDVAFEALICRPERDQIQGSGAWLAELGDGRRWTVQDDLANQYCRPPATPFATAPPPIFAAGPPPGRVTFQEFLDPHEERTVGFRNGTPVLLSRSGGMGRDDWDYTYSEDAEHCKMMQTWKTGGEVVRALRGRPAGCGGFGEIPVRDSPSSRASLESRRQWGTTGASFHVHAELDVEPDHPAQLALVTTVPPIDAPAPASARSFGAYDHFEVWLGAASADAAGGGGSGDPEPARYAVIPDGRGNVRVAGLNSAASGLVLAIIEHGTLRIGGDLTHPLDEGDWPALTLVFLDGDGHGTVGFVASGPFVNGRPHPFNRVASPGARFAPFTVRGAQVQFVPR